MTSSDPSYPGAPYHGNCLCGGVRYAMSSGIDVVSHCHCTMCRKAHGAAFATYGSVRRSAHRFTQGQGLLREFASSPQVVRSFCSVCGSPLMWRRTAGRCSDWVSIPLGTLDSGYVAPAHRHIHVASKTSWYEIEDHWPQSAHP